MPMDLLYFYEDESMLIVNTPPRINFLKKVFYTLSEQKEYFIE